VRGAKFGESNDKPAPAGVNAALLDVHMRQIPMLP
jgi:hypothetical protein